MGQAVWPICMGLMSIDWFGDGLYHGGIITIMGRMKMGMLLMLLGVGGLILSMFM